MNLKGNDFLKLLDYSPEQIDYLLQLAAQLKHEKKSGIPHRLCEGKNVALIFEKTSTRTRCSCWGERSLRSFKENSVVSAGKM